MGGAASSSSLSLLIWIFCIAALQKPYGFHKDGWHVYVRAGKLKHIQNGRDDMLAKKMSLKVRYIGSKQEAVPAMEKSDKNEEVEVEDYLCLGTVVILKKESKSNHVYVILAPFDKKVSNKYFMSLDCPKLNPPPADSAKKNTEDKKKKDNQ